MNLKTLFDALSNSEKIELSDMLQSWRSSQPTRVEDVVIPANIVEVVTLQLKEKIWDSLNRHLTIEELRRQAGIRRNLAAECIDTFVNKIRPS